MDADSQEHFRCGDCNKVFAKRMDYNRHRKRHDKPYPCSLCERRFGLKTDLDRHRQTHRNWESARNLRCKFPGCKFSGTTRKDYLWKHLQKKHQDCQRRPSEKSLREYYEEFAREGQNLHDEQGLELLEAAKTGDVERVRDLLLRKADISTTDSRRQTPLELAVFANHGAVVKLLCEHGADINSIIYRAAISGKEAAMNLLIENGADIDYHGSQTHSSTALCHAVNHGNERMACFLIEKGADVNISNCGSGVTALHGAVLRSEGITRALLKANADVNAKDELGRTPLSFAVGTILASRIFNEATTKLLLEAGATVEQHRWDAMPPAFREQNAKYAPKY